MPRQICPFKPLGLYDLSPTFKAIGISTRRPHEYLRNCAWKGSNCSANALNVALSMQNISPALAAQKIARELGARVSNLFFSAVTRPTLLGGDSGMSMT